MFPRTFLVALLVAAASAARNMPADNAAAAAGAAPQAAVAANAPDPAVYARAVEVSDADRAAAAPIISFLKKIPTPPGMKEWRESGERVERARATWQENWREQRTPAAARAPEPMRGGRVTTRATAGSPFDTRASTPGL